MKDVIIVGRGLAASILMHAFSDAGIGFTCIGLPSLSNSSRVAAGIWNPVVFKRLTKSWMAETLVQELDLFYARCEKRLGAKLVSSRKLIKPFTEEQEKVLWLKKAANELDAFLDRTIHDADVVEQRSCLIPNQYGCVKQAGNLNMEAFLSGTEAYFKSFIVNETFDHSRLQLNESGVEYNDLKARRIVFCEGYRVKDNPLFNWIPLKPAKGEVLTIACEDLGLKNSILNRNGFIMDLGNNLYKVGATYAWDDNSELPTEKAKQELEQKIKQLITCPYRLVKHEAGIRPSSADRRPIVGAHPMHPQVFVLNGLGTKGVMLGPFVANNFVHFIIENKALLPEMDVKRFYHLYETSRNA